MDKKDYKVVAIPLSNDVIARLEKLAKEESRTVSQQAAIIIYNYFKDYKKVLELVNQKDFGAITEESLRKFLKREENQIDYKYEDIEDYTFDELFKFWLENFYKDKKSIK